MKTFDCSYFNENGDAEEGSKVLDCPELLALAIDWREKNAPVLNCPKLSYLKYVQYSHWVSRLDSLEVLNLKKLTNSSGILSNHPKLHTLNVFSVKKAVLKELVRRKAELGRSHLKIFVRSLPVNDEMLKVFDQIFHKEKHLGYFTVKGVEFYSKHEQEFRDDFFVFDEYEDIVIDKESFANLKLLTDQTSIFRKIYRAHSLYISDRDSFSQDQLIDLMRKMPNVHFLTCYRVPSLDQAFFDQLPSILEFLSTFYIEDASVDWEDLSFILRFRELVDFLAHEHKHSDEDWRIETALQKKNGLDFGQVLK